MSYKLVLGTIIGEQEVIKMEWIITCKTSVYDVFSAFNDMQEIDWRKSFNIKKNDIVYIYVSAPYSKIMYKTICINEEVSENDMKDDRKYYKDSEQAMMHSNCIRLKKIQFVDKESLSIETLRNQGLIKLNIQGAFKSKNYPDLFEYLNEEFQKDTIDITKDAINFSDERVITFPAGDSYDFSVNSRIHAHPLKKGYPSVVPKYLALRQKGSKISEIFVCDKIVDLKVSEMKSIFSFLNDEENSRLQKYITERTDKYEFSHPEYKYRFYFLYNFIELPTIFECGHNLQSAKYYELDEIININQNNILFCNISYMQKYDGDISNDKPVNGEQYIKDTGDALEKYNFYICKDNMIRGFVETKHVGGYENAKKGNSLHIERINKKYKNEDYIKDVTVVFCARSPSKNKTLIVGWYKNAIVYRNRQVFGTRQFNIIAKAEDCTLLNEDNRTYVIPRASIDGVGFGQSNLWYANNSIEENKIALEVLDYINNYSSETGTLFKIITNKIKVRNSEVIATNYSIDDKTNRIISGIALDSAYKYEYSDTLVKRAEYVDKKGIKIYKRNKKIAINALGIAGFKCEINQEHPSFLRKKDGLPYTESHHLIPMSAQDDFEYSLDIEENIVSLCSNCHNEIHYGKKSIELITALYEERKELLEKKQIFITLEQLLSYYE